MFKSYFYICIIYVYYRYRSTDQGVRGTDEPDFFLNGNADHGICETDEPEFLWRNGNADHATGETDYGPELFRNGTADHGICETDGPALFVNGNPNPDHYGSCTRDRAGIPQP